MPRSLDELFHEQRTLVYRSHHALPSHLYLYQGGPCTLRERGNSDTTDKLGGWQDSPSQRWFQPVFCDRFRLRMSIAARARNMQAQEPIALRITRPEIVIVLIPFTMRPGNSLPDAKSATR